MICATLSSSDNGVKRARKEFLIALVPRWRSSSTAIRDGERDGEYESSRLAKDSRHDKSDVGDDESSDDSDYASDYDSSDGDDSNSDGDHHIKRQNKRRYDLLSTGSAVTDKGITTSQQKLRRSKSKSSSTTTTTALSSPLSSNSMKTNVIKIDKIFDALTSYTPTQVIGTTDQSISRRSLSVDQLKSLLRQHKLPVYGTKDILLARMYENNISTELVL